MPTSRATETTRRTTRRDRSGGFTLIETMLALAVVALIAALALPRGLVGSQTGAVRAAAMQVAALARSDRNAALRTGRPVETLFDPQTRILHAGGTGAAVRLPAGVALRLEPSNLAGFTFLPNGSSSGGTIVLGSGAGAYRIAVNPVTAAVEADRVDLSAQDLAAR